MYVLYPYIVSYNKSLNLLHRLAPIRFRTSNFYHDVFFFRLLKALIDDAVSLNRIYTIRGDGALLEAQISLYFLV
jgi:hypothetical protein